MSTRFYRTASLRLPHRKKQQRCEGFFVRCVRLIPFEKTELRGTGLKYPFPVPQASRRRLFLPINRSELVRKLERLKVLRRYATALSSRGRARNSDRCLPDEARSARFISAFLGRGGSPNSPLIWSRSSRSSLANANSSSRPALSSASNFVRYSRFETFACSRAPTNSSVFLPVARLPARQELYPERCVVASQLLVDLRPSPRRQSAGASWTGYRGCSLASGSFWRDQAISDGGVRTPPSVGPARPNLQRWSRDSQ